MTQFLLKAWDGLDYGEVFAATVNIGPKQAAKYLSMLELAAELKDSNDGFYCIEFWDYAPTWYEYHESLEAVSDPGWLVLDAPLDDEPLTEVRTAAVRVTVGADGVHWEGHCKYTGIAMHTAGLDRRDLMAVIAAG
jgi:hypothetical protein